MKALGIGLLVALMAWGIGFAWFIEIAGRAGSAPAHSDGIVAFTGGAERVERGAAHFDRGGASCCSRASAGGGACELAPRRRSDALAPAWRSGAADERQSARKPPPGPGRTRYSLLVVTASTAAPARWRNQPGAPNVALSASIVPADGPDTACMRLIAEEYVSTGHPSVAPR
jgi:hypothetical protein